MELVTGRKGSPHITSQQDRQKNQGTWGEDAYIMKTGNMLEPQVQSSNEIHIMDGALMFQGALFAVKVGTYDVVTINNGSQGMLRKDLIVARYTYDVAQNVESAEWVVIQGEPAESNPALPTPTSGDIQTGSTTVDCPVFAVNLDGINVTGVDIIPEYADTIPELMEAVAELNSKIEIIDGWTVIKHANGKCECWRRFSWNTYPGTAWKYGLYFSTDDFPGGFPVTFIDTPVVEITPNQTNQLYWLAATGVTATSFRITCYSLSQENLATVSGIYVVGRWK